MHDFQAMRSSLRVAPLAIQKTDLGSESESSQTADDASQASTNLYTTEHITPPSTPDGSEEDLDVQQNAARPVFHNFLRAFYPFHPNFAISDSTVTLPLNEGDVVLVHSIHTNGWADGTLLVSGARGWLPTNYCEAYDPEEMRNLLKALLNFWDLLRSTATSDGDIFGNQEFMKGIIAGVRFLLERTNCLTREASTIQRNESLRRGRKSLLSELSSLVKTAKRLQETLRTYLRADDGVNEIIDEMILKAFKIVVKGVRFLDVLEEERRLRAPPAVTVMATLAEETYVPPTPPAESTSTFEDSHSQGQDAGSRSDDNSHPADGAQTNASTNKRLSSVYSPANASGHRLSQASPMRGNRLSASISHRVSFAGPSPLSQSQNLVSERLNSSHDTFLSYLGSCIGRLHLQSQSRPELALAIKQSATSGGELFAVIDTVCRHSSSESESLNQARTAMFDHIRDLVYSARDILSAIDPDAEDIIMPQDNSRLLLAATGCVKAAGECVAKTKWVLERIGDFEFENEQTGLGISLEVFDKVSESRPRTPEASVDPVSKTPEASPETKRASVRSSHLSLDKPLPEIPGVNSQPATRTSAQYSPPPSRPQSIVAGEDVDSVASTVSSVKPSLPPLPRLRTSISLDDSYSPMTDNSHDGEYHSSFRSDTTSSSAGSNMTYLSRDSESSLVSQAPTRATTPDSELAPRAQPSMSELSVTGSTGTSEEVDEVENKLLEKTFAHELLFNKEGHVTGGSLPALVERLTTHESTPDAVFVSAFYLTFRLFCSPSNFAAALIDRFEYVGDSLHMASPVRLRVYNVIKGWLESHWRDSTDREALPALRHFAEFQLGSLLPSAGKRLVELADRVSSTDGSLVPRLVSSMGKTSTSIAQYVPVDTPLPNPIISRSQNNLLSAWKNGGTSPSVLDFEPLEIARQLTMKQMNIFCSILPEELLGSQWMKKGGVDSPNVKAMSGLSTDLSNVVADTILQHSDVKKRAAVIKQWIKVAHQCLQLNNYDGLMAIICSLNSSIISRLRKTWEFVSPKRREMLQALQTIVEPSNNNKVLRARLQGHVPPCLPFLGMFLTDLTFVDIGNPATKQLPGAGSDEHGLTVVNFDKHTRTAKIIGELQRFQIPYRLTEVADMQEWLQSEIVRVKESEQGTSQITYYRKSLMLEPRETPLKTPVEAPTAQASHGQKADLFSWMTGNRGQQSHATVAI
ncbi:ras GEF [Apiospora arundinis]|uniref:Ras GEF n=1 Tax=Apiospora arundinis TaxID=335852 RepID=A0ABR2IFE2_9PEZI